MGVLGETGFHQPPADSPALTDGRYEKVLDIKDGLPVAHRPEEARQMGAVPGGEYRQGGGRGPDQSVRLLRVGAPAHAVIESQQLLPGGNGIKNSNH